LVVRQAIEAQVVGAAAEAWQAHLALSLVLDVHAVRERCRRSLGLAGRQRGGVVAVGHRVAGAIATPELGRVVVAARAENVPERMPIERPHRVLVRVLDLGLRLLGAHDPEHDRAVEATTRKHALVEWMPRHGCRESDE